MFMEASFKWVMVVLAVLSLSMLAACGKAPEQPTQPSQPDQPSQPEQPGAPVAPTEPVKTPAEIKAGPTPGCPTTAERVQYNCQLKVLPEKGEGCTFHVPADGFGKEGGDVTYTKVSATVDDYVAAYEEIYPGEETYELKPRSTRREKKPYSYFFWFTGDSLITMTGTTSLCPSDRLKRLVVEMESGIEQKAPEPFCGVSTKGTCAVDADCVVSGCSSQVCGAATEEPLVTTCEDKACYKARNFGLSCRCMERQCQWG